MNLFILISVLSIGLQARALELDAAFESFLKSASSARSAQSQTAAMKSLFKVYQKEFYRRAKTSAEETIRYNAFKETVTTLLKITQQSNNTHSFQLNKFSDRTAEELKGTRGLRPPQNHENSTSYKSSLKWLPLNGNLAQGRSLLPASFDYTTLFVDGTRIRIIQPIKDQGFCGSCYAFAFITLLEAFCTRYHRKPCNLSEQQIVDCSSYDAGCNSGYFTKTFDYFKSNLWISNNARVYPYRARRGACASVDWFTSYMRLPRLAYMTFNSNRADIMQRVLYDYSLLWVSLFVGDNTSPTNTNILHSFYSLGTDIFNVAGCPNTVAAANHAVVIVGYGVDPLTGIPFWKARNSWGTDWGDKGYFRIRRGVNMCGIEAGPFAIGRQT